MSTYEASLQQISPLTNPKVELAKSCQCSSRVMKHTSTYLDIDELAQMLGRSSNSIRRDLANRPFRLPPKMHFPCSKMLRWRICDVENWMYETGWAEK
jgi:predicted DNA-binding transcriptional regulator AlpA